MLITSGTACRNSVQPDAKTSIRPRSDHPKAIDPKIDGDHAEFHHYCPPNTPTRPLLPGRRCISFDYL